MIQGEMEREPKIGASKSVVSKRVVSGPAASALHGHFIEMQCLIPIDTCMRPKTALSLWDIMGTKWIFMMPKW